MFNKVTLLGNLTRDIELRYLQSGKVVASTAIATSRKFKGQDGQSKEKVMFIDISAFGRLGEIMNQYLRKGSKVFIEGTLELDQWTDQSGQKRSKHTVVVNEMKMLDSKQDGGNQQGYGQQQQQQQSYQQPQQQQQSYQQPQQQQQSYQQPSQQQNGQQQNGQQQRPQQQRPAYGGQQNGQQQQQQQQQQQSYQQPSQQQNGQQQNGQQQRPQQQRPAYGGQQNGQQQQQQQHQQPAIPEIDIDEDEIPF